MKRSSIMARRVLEVPPNSLVFQASRSGFDRFGYAPGIVSGRLLTLSGQVGVRPDGSTAETVAEQAEWAFKRTTEILSWEGLTWADVVEVITYHVDINKNLAEFIPVKSRYFEKPYPTWTILGIEGLARPELKIEIVSVAALRE